MKSKCPDNLVQKILTEELGMRKVCAKWVPHLRNNGQRSCRVAMWTSNLRWYLRKGMVSYNGSLYAMKHVLSSHSWEAKPKRQSVMWRRSGSSRPQKVTRFIAQLIVTHTTLFDHQRQLLDQSVQAGQTINSEFYLSALEKVCRAIYALQMYDSTDLPTQKQ